MKIFGWPLGFVMLGCYLLTGNNYALAITVFTLFITHFVPQRALYLDILGRANDKTNTGLSLLVFRLLLASLATS